MPLWDTLPWCRLVIFGGRSQEKKRLNDVHFLDTETWTWHRAVTEGAVPVPRCSAAAVIMEGQLILFGGSAAGGLCLWAMFAAQTNQLHLGIVKGHSALLQRADSVLAACRMLMTLLGSLTFAVQGALAAAYLLVHKLLEGCQQ